MAKVLLRTKRIIQNVVGDGKLLSVHLQEHFFLPFLYTVSVIVVVLMLSMSFFTNICVNHIPTLASFTGILFLMTWITVFWHFVINSQRFYLLLDDLGHLVGESEYLAYVIIESLTKIIVFSLILSLKE